jgi:hypothetical protein
MAMTCSETRLYLSKSGETMRSSGHSRSARAMGIAERTP